MTWGNARPGLQIGGGIIDGGGRFSETLATRRFGFAGISGHIPCGIEARQVGFHAGGHGNVIAFHFETPLGQRSHAGFKT